MVKQTGLRGGTMLSAEDTQDAGDKVALLIFPIGLVLGWIIRSPGRAAVATAAVGIVTLVVLGVLWFDGEEVSPLETLVIVVGTPTAAAMAFKVAEWRRSRHTPV